MNDKSLSKTKILPLVIVLTLIWGTNWVLFPIAVREISIWTFRAICLLGSGVIVLLAAHLKGIQLHVPVNERKPLAAAGLIYLIIWNVATTYAAILLPSGQAAVLGFTMPVWATILSWLVLREKPSTILIVSVMLASVGVGLLAFASRSAYATAPFGFVAGLSAGLGWAVGTLILKRASLTVPAVVSTGWQLVIAGIPMTIAALLLGTREAFMPSWNTLIVIGYITVIPMALGNVIWFSIANLLPSSVSGMSTVMVPVVAMATGAAIRGEPLGILETGAMLCCVGAMALVLFKRR